MKRFLCILSIISILALALPVAPVRAEPQPYTEVVSLRTISSKTYYYGGAQYAVKISLDWIHYQDALGQWQEIDESSTEADTGNFTAKFNKLPYVIRMGDDGKRRIYPDRNDLSYWFEIGKPFATMPTPTKAGNTWTWDFTNGTIILKATSRTAKFDFILKNSSAPSSITFPIASQGITRNGNLLLHNGIVVAELVKPFAIDANGVNRDCVATWTASDITISCNTTGLVYPIVVDPTVTIRPDAAGSETNITYQYPESGAHWDKIDEASSDSDSTYVAARGVTPTGEKRDLYAVPDQALSGGITDVSVYVTAREESDSAHDGYVKPSVRTHSVTYDGASQEVTTTYAVYSKSWTTNPNTGVAWTWAEIDAMEIGVAPLYPHDEEWNPVSSTRVTQVYTIITYNSVAVTTVSSSSVNGTTAVASGEITSLTSGNATVRGFQWTLTSGDYSACTNVTEAGSFDIGAYSLSLPSLPTNTTIYFRAMATNPGGTGYGGELNLLTLGTPTINADNVSLTSVTTARLNSNLTFDGNSACTITFGFGNVTQTAANFASYDNKTAVAGTFVTGNHPYLDVTGLVGNTVYYYRAQATNTYGTANSTQEQVFTTSNSIGDMTSFSANPSDTSIYLSWSKASGASKTLVRYATDTYPTTTSGGTQVYLGSSNSYEHTGLTPGSTLYYSAWGEDGGSYSTTKITLVMTTLAQAVTDIEVSEPGAISGWRLTPEEPDITYFQPFHDMINGFVDSFGAQRGVSWMGFALFGCIVGSVWVAKKTGSFSVGVIALAVCIFIGVIIKVLPGWMILLEIAFALIIWSIRRSGGD